MMGFYFRIPLPGPFGYSVRLGGRKRRRRRRPATYSRPAPAPKVATETEKVRLRQAIKRAIERADQDSFDLAMARFHDMARTKVGGDDLGSLGHMEIVQAAEREEIDRHTQVIRTCIGHVEGLADAQAAVAAYNRVAEKVNRRVDMMNSIQPGSVPEEDKLERIEISGDGDDMSQPPTQPPQQARRPDSTAPHPYGYGRTVQPPRSSVYDPRFGNRPPPRPPKQRAGWEWWTRRRVVVAASLFAVLVLIGVIANAAGPPTPTPVSHHKPAAAASPSPSPSVTSSAAAVIESPAAATTTPAQQATTTQPAVQQTTQAPPLPPPTGCYPKAPSGNCYEPGEYCPTADAGMTGVAGDGETIVCIFESGRYHWHPTS